MGAPLVRKAPPRAFNVSDGQATWGTARQVSRRYLITRTRYIEGICLSASMVLAVKVLVGVEHGVGVLAGGLVGHTLHVGVVLGKDGRDLADHVGHVGVQAGNAACGARALPMLQAG